MCGILGFVLRAGRESGPASQYFDQAVQTLRHRGPDAQARWRDERVLLGHTRLSIIELSELGSQPMPSADGRCVISYNGEVYNFRELAASHGLHDLRSGSDTEVVLRLFEKQGVGALAGLNGMFAFAIYDRRARRLWLARDRLGIKPLFYSLDADGLTFASEIKSIHAIRGTAPRCEIAALHEWLYYGNPLGGHTLHQGIQQLLPGHYLELDLETFACTTRAYWSLEEQAKAGSTRRLDTREIVAETRRLLEQAVRRQLVADVPVGLFLSGGVDSSAIAAFASKHYGGRLATYSAGFDFQQGEGELPRARRVAERFGTEHHEFHIRGGAVSELVEKLIHHHDMPFGDAANIPLALMAAEISTHTKVVLQGDGGDELFGGYSRYFTLGRYSLLRPGARVLERLLRLTRQSAFHYRARRYLRALAAPDLASTMALLLTSEDRCEHPQAIFTPDLRRRVERSDPFARHRDCLRMFDGQDRVNQMSFLDMLITLPDTFLEKVDRATMAASLEVRVPFLDHDLLDFAVSLPGNVKVPGGKKKWLLKSALEGVVPEEVLQGPKTGLEVPYSSWLQGSLRPLFFDHLAKFSRRNPGILDTERVNRLYAQTAAGGKDDSYMLWKVLNLMIWTNNFNVTFER